MLLCMRSGKKTSVVHFAEEQFPPEAHCNGRVADAAACSATITKTYAQCKSFLPRHLIPTIVSLASTHTQSALVTLPRTLVNETRVLEEAGKDIPIHPETTLTDWQIVDEHDDKAEIFVVSTPRSVSDALATTLEMSGCFPSIIENESIALARLFGGNEPRGIIDLGASRTLLLITRGEIPLFTMSLPFTGHMLTEQIARTLKLSFAEAEETKKRCGFDTEACKGALREVIADYLDDTVTRITTALEQLPTTQTPLKTLTLVGGGAHLKQLDTVLTQELGIPVTLGSLWTTIEKPKNFPDNELAWAVALGLSMRGFSV